jgi:hypothetical protein
MEKKMKKEKKVIRQRFIIDESGSMGPQQMSIINGFNEQLDQMRREQRTLGVRYLVSLTKFSYGSTVVYADRPLKIVPKLTTETYKPNGGTALLDALGENLVSGGVGDCLVTIMTDGEENCSRTWSREQVKSLIEMRTKENNWGFVYFGANQDAWQEGNKMGIYNTVNYTVNNTEQTMNAMSRSRGAYTICSMMDDYSASKSGLVADINEEELTKV